MAPARVHTSEGGGRVRKVGGGEGRGGNAKERGEENDKMGEKWNESMR